MAIKQAKSVADIPSSELEDWRSVPQPISETVSQLSGIIINEHPDGSEAGILGVYAGYVDTPGDGCGEQLVRKGTCAVPPGGWRNHRH